MIRTNKTIACKLKKVTMRHPVSRNWIALTLMILVICVLSCCTIACVLVYRFVSSWNASLPAPCRDDILRKIPIYPNATLIRSEDIGDRSDGWTERTYQTADTFEDVMMFYADASPPCAEITFREVYDGWDCMGIPEGDDQGFYEARISTTSEPTTYLLLIEWHCR
jgi:hypothetical protein